MTVQNTDSFHIAETTMSSLQSNVFIPMFTGTNWSQWWPTMTTYIKASGYGWAMDFPAPMLDPKANNNECNFYIT